MHTGLLEELDTDLDRTGSRLAGARRGLDRVAKGARDNGESFIHGHTGYTCTSRPCSLVKVMHTDSYNGCGVGSTVTIGVLILVLLILIIVFKT